MKQCGERPPVFLWSGVRGHSKMGRTQWGVRTWLGVWGFVVCSAVSVHARSPVMSPHGACDRSAASRTAVAWMDVDAIVNDMLRRSVALTLQSGALGRALQILGVWEHVRGDDPCLRLLRVRIYRRQGQYAHAWTQIRKLYARHFDHPEVLWEYLDMLRFWGAWTSVERLIRTLPPEMHDTVSARWLQQIRMAITVTYNVRTEATPHFIVHLHPRVPRKWGAWMVRTLEDGYRGVRDFLPEAVPDAPWIVWIMPPEALQVLVPEPTPPVGMFDGRIWIRFPIRRVNRHALRSTVMHEVCHAMLHTATRGEAPVWLHEGWAEWCSRTATDGSVRSARISLPDRLPEADTFFAMVPVPLHRPDSPAMSTVAAAWLDSLLRLYGMGTFRRWIRAMHTGVDWRTAFRRVYRTTPETLYTQWRNASLLHP